MEGMLLLVDLVVQVLDLCLDLLVMASLLNLMSCDLRAQLFELLFQGCYALILVAGHFLIFPLVVVDLLQDRLFQAGLD